MTEDIPEILDRNATCPICHKYYHNIDVWNNPIPSAKHKRTDDELCQCGKGMDAREQRRKWRMDRKEDNERRATLRKDILSMEERNQVYWQNVRANMEVRMRDGFTTED